MSLSIIIPVFNEEASIERCILRTLQVFVSVDLEIIVVNDGSSDASDKKLRELAGANPRLKYFCYSDNQGYGYAIRTGLEKATKEYIAFLDADLQYQPEDLLKMYDFAMKNDIPVVIGDPEEKYRSFRRSIFSRIFNQFALRTFGINVPDVNSLKLIQKKLVMGLKLRTNHFLFDLELLLQLIKIPVAIETIPVLVSTRDEGKSKSLTLPIIWQSIVEFFYMAVTESRGKDSSIR